MDLPPDLVSILAHFAPLFAGRTWPKAQLLVDGALPSSGRRTVASALPITRRGQDRDFTNSHRLLDAAGRLSVGLAGADGVGRGVLEARPRLAVSVEEQGGVGRQPDRIEPPPVERQAAGPDAEREEVEVIWHGGRLKVIRGHQGMETQGQWSAPAIKRKTTVLMGLYWGVCLPAMR